MLLLEIKKLLLLLGPTTTSVGYGLMRLSPRLLSESILRNPLPEASRIPLLSSGWRERSCNVAARIMRWGGSPARALTSSDAIRDKDYA